MTNAKNDLFKSALQQLLKLTDIDLPESKLIKTPEFQRLIETLKEIKNNGYKEEFISFCNLIMA